MDLNKVTLIGDMIRDPESRVTTGGQRIVRFSLATNYAWQDAKTKVKKETIDFHDVIAWGKLGDIIQQYVKKGARIYVEGRLRKRRVAAYHGQPRMTTEIVAYNMIMLGHRTQRTKPDPTASKLIREDIEVDEEAV